MLDPKLYSLLKVAETGNFTQAANALNLTQPAVSQHIKALEDECNVKIFERVGNRIILTRQGDKVVETAKTILGIYKNMLNEFTGIMSGTQEINIGITHTVESNRITEVLARYASENIGITIRLFTGTPAKIRRKLKNYELNLAIVDGSFEDSMLETRQLDVDQLVVVVDPSHRLAAKKSVSLQEIKNEKLILRLPESGTGNLFKSSVESADLRLDEFNVILEVDNIATIKDLVRRGYGVSVIARSACVDEIQKRKLVALPIENINLTRVVSVAYAPNFPYHQFLEEFINAYQQAY